MRKPILKYSVEEFDRSSREPARQFHVLMVAGRIMTAQKSGSIVLFSSIRSMVTEPGQSVYSMTKAGILQLAKTAATEWAEPGRARQRRRARRHRDAIDRADQGQPRLVQRLRRQEPDEPLGATPSEMAGPTVFLLSDAASYVTGTIIYADGGWLAADGRFTPPGM